METRRKDPTDEGTKAHLESLIRNDITLRGKEISNRFKRYQE
jgi:hypothetical protein